MANTRDVVETCLYFPDHARVYLITGLFYCSLEIELFFPFNLLPGLEIKGNLHHSLYRFTNHQLIKLVEDNITLRKSSMYYNAVMLENKSKVKQKTDGSLLYYVALENVSAIGKRTHIATGRGGRDKMVSELSTKLCQYN